MAHRLFAVWKSAALLRAWTHASRRRCAERRIRFSAWARGVTALRRLADIRRSERRIAVTYKQASRFSEVVVLGMELPLGFTALIQTAVHPSIEWGAGQSFPEDDGNSRFAH